MEKLHIYWTRRDFRIHDNKALSGAVAGCADGEGRLLPVFVLENYMTRATSDSQFGYPSRYMIANAVPEFAKNFKEFVVLQGHGADSIIQLAQIYSKDFESITLHVNEDVYIDFYKQIEKIKRAHISVQVYQDRLTVQHDTVTGQGNVYSVFTPFRNAVWSSFLSATIAKKPNLDDVKYIGRHNLDKLPNRLDCKSGVLWSVCSHKRLVRVDDREYDLDVIVKLFPNFDEIYTSEDDAHRHFSHFLKVSMEHYNDRRDGLGLEATSKMSTALAWGFVSARMLVHAIKKHFKSEFTSPYSTTDNAGAIQYLNELIWREFYGYLLFHKPALMNMEFQEKFRGTIHWKDNSKAHDYFIAWIKGETGYPVVDAAMKEIQATGQMHNRARMIVSSFLTKHLGVDWRWGQEYFRAMLIDIDESSNNGGWQWGASVGADPKPIRIFNPTLQADKYDRDFAYRKKWLGDSFDPAHYIDPIVEHKQARANAISRYKISSAELYAARDY